MYRYWYTYQYCFNRYHIVPFHSLKVFITPMLLVANLSNTKMCKNPEKLLKPWHMGTHLIVLCESFLMNTNKTGFQWFSKIFSILVLWTKIASALEGLTIITTAKLSFIMGCSGSLT